jgi:hypothetical protein
VTFVFEAFRFRVVVEGIGGKSINYFFCLAKGRVNWSKAMALRLSWGCFDFATELERHRERRE